MDIKEMTSKASEGLGRAQERAEHLGQTATEALDEARQGTAAALENAAASLRTTGTQGAETIGNLSGKTAEKMDSAAAYMRSHDLGGMLVDLRETISRHPAGFAFLAAGLGFLAGSALRRNKSRD